MFPIIDNRYLYMAVDAWYKAMSGPAAALKFTADQLEQGIRAPGNEQLFQNNPLLGVVARSTEARLRLFQRLTQSYNKPAFGIAHTVMHGKTVPVKEEVAFKTPFCRLLHFKKDSNARLPRLLLIAPMAGHHATLLRDTVRDSLPFYDVYITDWMNARDVPISEGGFDMDSYVSTLIRCFEFLAPDFHVIGICQSGVPAYAAVSLLEARSEMHGILPSTLTLMGAPIDVRSSPTSVNNYASQHNEDWFERSALSIVPDGFPGERRLVYPGFMQLAAFLSMNPERHQKSISDAMLHYTQGDFEGEEKISSFYAEYFSVMDMTAEFYLQTIRVVFQEALLPQGKMVFHGRMVDPAMIRKTPIFAVEGERDDICGLGQTKAALELATNLPDSMKHYLMLKEAGHYGLFNGHRYREIVLPALHKFTGEKALKVVAANS